MANRIIVRRENSPPGGFQTGPARACRRGLLGVAAVAALACGGAGVAAAVPGVGSPGSTEANVAVSSAIALTGLTPSFTLTGVPGATVTGLGAVTMNVATNNLAGYAVTVESATATMAAGAPTNLDSVPIGALSVRESATTNYAALSSTVVRTVHTQSTRSIEAGDTISNDYQVVIPFVNEDTYTATLNYIATTL
ncbi:hypothetical protein [Kribbella kalugense]|uniref:Uncharacterized protein n=1 Tax=Kribbella kalugense TaxID=2512221 RepID=A0A4R8A4H5_9ACTN|nr:hypothetical protein [Kribbella kalugense]TDW24388.1 hypothetical protein EV650_3267 [Kribbella kalugense]